MSADKSITYSSTRGCPTQANLSFRDVVMRGLSHDRGLFVPDAFPTVTKEEVESWRSLPYHELATNVIGKFVKDDQVPRAKLAEIVEKSCAAFRSEDVTPVIDVGGHMILVRPLVFLSILVICACTHRSVLIHTEKDGVKRLRCCVVSMHRIMRFLLLQNDT